MGNDTQLNIIVRAQNAASQVLKQVENDVKGVAGRVDGAMKAALPGSAAIAAGVAAAGAATVAFGVSSITAYNAAAEATKKLTTNMLNVKGATMEQVTGLESLASKLQAVGVIEDDVIKAGMSQLATFNLQSSSIATLTPKITDMVAQMKGQNATAEDMVGINNLVGKVMTGNVGALSRYGVTLSETQKKQLESGNETERASLLSSVLAQNYGEVNKALRDTPEGKITGLKNAFGDLQEGVGEMLLTAGAPIIDWFTKLVDGMEESGGIMGWLQGIFERNKGTIMIVGGAIMGALVPALYAAAGGFVAIMVPLLPFMAVGALVAVMANSLANSMGGWSAVLDSVQNALTPLNGVMGFFGDVLGRIVDFFNANPIFSAAGLGALGAVILSALVPAFIGWAAAAGAAAVATLAATWPILAIGAAIAGVAYLVVTNWDTISAAFGAAIGWIGEKITWFKDHFFESIGFVLGFFATLPIKLPFYVYQAISSIIGIISSINWGAVFSSIGRAFEGVWNWVKDAAKNAWNYMSNINWGQMLSNVGKGIGNSIMGLIEGAINGAMSGIPGSPKVKLPRFANGVRDFGGGWAITGERGPELTYLPKGSNVYSNEESQGMMGGTTNNLNGTFNFGSGEAVDRFFDRLNTDAANAAIGAAV